MGRNNKKKPHKKLAIYNKAFHNIARIPFSLFEAYSQTKLNHKKNLVLKNIIVSIVIMT